MNDMSVDSAAFAETVVYLKHFNDLHDPRQPGKVALFETKKLPLLRRFRPLKDGTPTHDHLGGILAILDAEQFQSCFVAWVAAVAGVPAGVIAIDGKTVRRSGQKGAKGATTLKHMALNSLRRPPGKQSIRGRRKAASWDNDYLASLINE